MHRIQQKGFYLHLLQCEGYIFSAQNKGISWWCLTLSLSRGICMASRRHLTSRDSEKINKLLTYSLLEWPQSFPFCTNHRPGIKPYNWVCENKPPTFGAGQCKVCSLHNGSPCGRKKPRICSALEISPGSSATRMRQHKINHEDNQLSPFLRN